MHGGIPFLRYEEENITFCMSLAHTAEHVPQGLRAYLRVALRYTYSKVTAPYVVHELRDVPYLHGDVNSRPEDFNVNIDHDYR